MYKIAISSDSTLDLSNELIKKYNIHVMPLHVLLGDKDYKDGVNITPNDIFNYVKKTNTLPKTSACTQLEYFDFFSKLLQEYDSVIHFSISSKCSSTHNDARLAALELDGKVRVIDSLNLSTGQGLLVLKACDYLNEGLNLEEIINNINSLLDKVQTSFVVDTTDYLYKGGRCSAAALVATKLLLIHPAIEMKNGTLGVKKKYRGNLKKCIENYVKDLANEFSSYDDTRVFITHSSCDDDIVSTINDTVKKNFKFKEVLTTVAGSVVTSHCGKGTLGVLFITK